MNNQSQIEKNQEIAKTILQQLGGNKFLVMTGSKNLVSIDNGLQMHLTRNLIGAKYLRIVLNGLDLYDIEFSKLKKDEVVILKRFENIYADQLKQIFTETTGLYTNL